MRENGASSESLDNLRRQASRADYSSMAALALGCYRRGLRPPQVMSECYGVKFPQEFFVLAESDRDDTDLFLEFMNQPWELATPPERGGPSEIPRRTDESERQLFDADADLVPLVRLLGLRERRGGSTICYRLGELSEGRAAVFEIKRGVRPGGPVTRCGDSLLDVLLEHHTEAYETLEKQRNSESNFGFGTVDDDEVAEVREVVEQVVELRRRADARGA
ncbi:hypothetical protein [Streptomyces sp. NPDC014734]|uniref:hypothetical protein n=1 Tax=Streptomyces sp. NPDC014734 TaxID=3364886 RepID=UPI0036FB8107